MIHNRFGAPGFSWQSWPGIRVIGNSGNGNRKQKVEMANRNG